VLAFFFLSVNIAIRLGGELEGDAVISEFKVKLFDERKGCRFIEKDGG